MRVLTLKGIKAKVLDAGKNYKTSSKISENAEAKMKNKKLQIQ